MKKLLFLIPLLSITLLFSGCGKQTTSDACPISSGSFSCWTTSWWIDHSDFTWAVNSVLLSLKNQNFATLTTFVWSQWLRFSPYENVNIWTDVVLSTGEVENALSISRSYLWWNYDGSWEPIDLWIGQYFEKFVTDADWATAPEINYNQSTQRGNIINNISAVYPGTQSKWVEFYFSGFDAQYGGMDRKSLTLVFQNLDGQRYLIGIVHGQRTI